MERFEIFTNFTIIFDFCFFQTILMAFGSISGTDGGKYAAFEHGVLKQAHQIPHNGGNAEGDATRGGTDDEFGRGG